MKQHDKRHRWKLAKLKPHPRQASMFDDLPEVELEALAEDIAANGLRHPVEILPDGTIVAGHQRCRAAKHLGWTEIDVIIRHDLAAQGDDAVEAHFIRDNFTRRQLTPLGRARCLQRLIEVEGKIPKWNGNAKREALKTEIGKRLNMSGRNVARYLLVLDTPPEVQQAFDTGKLRLVEAGRVSLLAKAKRQALVQRIEAGEDVVKAVKDALAASPTDCDSPDRSFVRLVVALNREIGNLGQRVGEIDPQRLARCSNTLRSALDLVKALIARAKRAS